LEDVSYQLRQIFYHQYDTMTASQDLAQNNFFWVLTWIISGVFDPYISCGYLQTQD
jgi:hypothetical protein